MELKDVLHYYIGCRVFITNNIEDLPVYDTLTPEMLHNDFEELTEVNSQRYRLILRPLASMTKEEMEECGNLIYDFRDDPELNRWNPEDFEVLQAPEQFNWLLSRGFDLFNLIPRGLVVEQSKTLNT